MTWGRVPAPMEESMSNSPVWSILSAIGEESSMPQEWIPLGKDETGKDTGNNRNALP